MSVTNLDDDYLTYLPVVLMPPAGLPDLVVQDLTVANDEITVVVANVGDGPVVDPFWVDVYLNPDPVPTRPNQTWPLVAEEGLVWGISGDVLPLEPGDTLTVGDAYYDSDRSELGDTIAAGTLVYAQVDSANTQTDYGGVLETHEDDDSAYNNVAGPVMPAASVTADAAHLTPTDGTGGGAGLSPRPR